MLSYLLGLIWLFLPAALANMSPVMFRWLPLLNFPVDMGKKFRKKRILGKSKTWRGILVGVLTGIIIVCIQKYLLPNVSFALIDYSEVNALLLGFLMGAGALIGDLVESFFKRQVGIKPGKPWIPFDQTDWVFGSIIFSMIYVELDLKSILIAIVILGILHPTANSIGYLLKLREVPL